MLMNWWGVGSNPGASSKTADVRFLQFEDFA